jgi:cell division ATPase FtsA
MRALVTQQKLKDIAIAQAEEIMMLRTELERARLRTFPSFVERTGGHPDMR